jgi:hypothetical protein
MAATLNGRTRRVLQRFPYHLDAAQPGKLLANVTHALVRDQDVQSADLQGIRVAHRLYEARELIDLLRIGALHNISRSELALLFQRFSAARERYDALRLNVNSDGDLAEREALANEFLALWPISVTPALRAFSDDAAGTDPVDVAIAASRLLHSGAKTIRTQVLLDGIRQRIANIAAIHRVGNGTVTALLQGAANCLDVKLGAIEHSEDRYWHAAPVIDRIPLYRPIPGTDKTELIVPEIEFLGIEENPKRVAEFGPRPVRHAEHFHLLRKGFEDALLEIRLRGIGQRTLSPMFVNRDSGHGVGIFAAVPDGVEVVFTQGGRVVMNGKDVTSRCYSWQGACFAEQPAEQKFGEKNNQYQSDFVFADADIEMPEAGNPANAARISRFVEVTPGAGLNREGKFPHAGDSLSVPSVGIGKTRFAFFVQHGHFAALRADMPPLPDGVFGSDPFASTPALVLADRELVTPRYGAAIADASLFADRAGYSETDQPAAQLHLRWLERQAYKVRLFVPRRFIGFDVDEEGDLVKDYIALGIERFRPAGVDIEVQFIDSHWVLNEADLPHEDASLDSAISRIRSQTILSALPEIGS